MPVVGVPSWSANLKRSSNSRTRVAHFQPSGPSPAEVRATGLCSHESRLGEFYCLERESNKTKDTWVEFDSGVMNRARDHVEILTEMAPGCFAWSHAEEADSNAFRL